MLSKLVPGEVVTVTRSDRLARSTFDLFAILNQIMDAKAQFRSLAEPWADTGTSTGRLIPFPHTVAEERGHQAARAGRYSRRTRPQLQCQPRPLRRHTPLIRPKMLDAAHRRP